MATNVKDGVLEDGAWSPEQQAYHSVASELAGDTTGSDWGSLLGFLAGAGAALLAPATGGASLVGTLAAGAAGSTIGGGVGGLINEEEDAERKIYRGAGELAGAYKHFGGSASSPSASGKGKS